MIDWTTKEFIEAEVQQAFKDNPDFTFEDALLLKDQLAEEQALGKRIMSVGNSGNSKYKLLDHINDFHNNKMLFGLITDIYTNDGYGFPRSVILKAKRIAKEIPLEERLKDLPAGDPVTVYRADRWSSQYSLTPVKTAPSWTTNKNVAIWFAYRQRQPLTLWKAEIARDKIIAYLTCRNEFEVLQHNNVKNIEMLPAPTEDEISAALAEHERYKKEELEKLNKWAKENGYYTIDI